MYKRGVLLLAVLIVFSFMIVSAQNETTNDTFTNNIDTSSEFDAEVETGTEVSSQSETDILSEVESEYQDVELEVEAGTTPDSAFYFVDEFFDRFGDDLNVREEKIAEIKEMIREGKVEEARKSLDSYLALAEKIEAES